MTGKRHVQLGLTMGITGYAVLTQQYNINPSMLFGAGCVLGSLTPDIDLPNTTISNCVPFLPNILYRIFGHRGIIHTPLFLLLLNLAVLFWISNEVVVQIFLIGFSLGYIAHLIQDMFNQRGIMFFYPCKKRIRFCKSRCGATKDIVITVILAAIWMLLTPCLPNIVSFFNNKVTFL